MPHIRASQVTTEISAAIAQELVAAAERDGTTYGRQLLSRDEQATLAADLAQAADVVRQAQGRGATVMPGEAAGVYMQQAEERIAAVNQPSGVGRAYLSRAELERLLAVDPPMGARLQRAIDVILGKVEAPSPSNVSAYDLEMGLANCATYIDFEEVWGEGSKPFAAVNIPATLNAPLDGAQVAKAVGLDPTTDAGFVAKEERLDSMSDLWTKLADAQHDPTRARYVKTAQAMMAANLSEMHVFVFGRDGAVVGSLYPTYIVGIHPEGALLGLKTHTVWT